MSGCEFGKCPIFGNHKFKTKKHELPGAMGGFMLRDECECGCERRNRGGGRNKTKRSKKQNKTRKARKN